ncbi:MAG: hypothetical protein CML17_02415 [Pusillimonas sp.]|nr:hypothetical protein [Pusillimonas sp.]|tara:strand:+ start:14018 stop:14215 length:198 start_codon:yes stop_codon:yes gene_type:complete
MKNDLAVKFALRDGKDKYEQIALAIENDLTMRRGYKDVYDQSGETEVMEMRETWRNIIKDVLNVD